MGVRAVARVLGCAASAVVYWRTVADAGALGRWDRHGTHGAEYRKTKCSRTRAGRRLRHLAETLEALEASGHTGRPAVRVLSARDLGAMFADRTAVPVWLNEQRVKVAFARLARPLPFDTAGYVFRAWTTTALVWAFDFHLLMNFEETHGRASFLQNWRDERRLFEYQLAKLGFTRSGAGEWVAPREAEAESRLNAALEGRGQWHEADFYAESPERPP